jgi:hypothetical protein
LSVSTFPAHRTTVAEWFAFADFLAVYLEQKIGSLPGLKLLRDSRFDERLRLAVCGAIVYPLKAANDTNQHMRAIRRHGRNRSLAREEKDAVRAGVSDVRKTLQGFAYVWEVSGEERIDAPTVFIHYALGDLLEAHGAKLGHHAAWLQGFG